MSDDTPSGEEKPRHNPAYDVYMKMTPVELIKALGTMLASQANVKDRLSEVTGHVDFLRLVRIPAVFDEQDIKNMKVDEIGRCQLTSDIYASVKAGQKDAVLTWARDTGRGDLIVESINASTLKALLKAMLKSNTPIPDELFNVTPFSRASITKA